MNDQAVEIAEPKPRKNGNGKALAAIDAARAAAPIPPMMAALMSLAERPDLDVAKLVALTALFKEQQDRDARIAYATAFAELRAEMPEILKKGIVEYEDKKGTGKPSFKYAKWEDINLKITPVLSKHGFSLSFRTAQAERMTVTAVLLHRGGHKEETSMTLMADSSGGKQGPQQWGSAESYGKRYTAGALLNFSARDDDDDGVAAGKADPISSDQFGELKTLLALSGANLDAFLAHYKIEAIADLPAAKFSIAKQMLETKLAAKKELR